MKEENYAGLDSQLWHACAGGMVQMPSAGSEVYYFPQGHAEHAATAPEFPRNLKISPSILCRVVAVKYLADTETDEVYARIRLQPEGRQGREEEAGSGPPSPPSEKPASFAKTLTQSDANNGGGFSVPRYCAETIFPPLDYSVEPPVQTMRAVDVHGEVWKFRHIYRGTPRRHLLTTGWSTFVNQKKLVAGDAIVFLRGAAGELCVGVRRSARGAAGGVDSSAWHWAAGGPPPPPPPPPPYYRGLRWEPRGAATADGFLDRADAAGGVILANGSACGFARNRGKVAAKSVVEAATAAALGRPFEVVYYPRTSTPEFCVRARSVNAALGVQWIAGMRFKMAFETEDSSRVSWFMGTVSSVQFADPLLWPNSPWRLLQVAWDEPDLLQNVKRVNPWLVEVVSNMPSIQMTSLMLPKKKLRVTQPPEFNLESQGGVLGLQMATLANNVLGQINPWHSLSYNVPAGMQGARHDSIYGIGFSDIRSNKIQPSLFVDNLYREGPGAIPAHVSTDLNIGNFAQLEQSGARNNISHLLTMSNLSKGEHDGAGCPGSATPKSTPIRLFGKPIHTEQAPESQKQPWSGVSSSDGLGIQNTHDMGSPGLTSHSSTDGNHEAVDVGFGIRPHHCDGLETAGPSGIESLKMFRDQTAVLSLKKDIGERTSEDAIVHCKIFRETEEIGRTLDLTLFSTYEQLYNRLAKMFGIEELELPNRVLYKDMGNTVRHAGEEPYGNFMKTVRRLTIIADSSEDNMSR